MSLPPFSCTQSSSPARITVLTPFGTAVLSVASAAVVVAQVMILRSTRRAMRMRASGETGEGTPRASSPVLEWAFAIAPAIALAFLLFFTWRAATQPPVMQVEFVDLPTAGAAR